MAKTLGEKFRMVRGTMTQTELSKLLDIPQGYISRYEKGVEKPSLKFIYGMIKNFNVSVDWLLANEGDMYRSAQKEKMDPDIIEIINTLKVNKKLAKLVKQVLSTKDSAKLLKAVEELPAKKLKAIIELLD